MKNTFKKIIKACLPDTALQLLRKQFFKETNNQYFQTLAINNFADKQKTKIIAISDHLVKYNGGTKLYNLWIKLIRENGFDAYIATINGKYDNWLVEHQPVVSYKDVDRFREKGYDVRILSGWLDTQYFQDNLDDKQFYYFDAELTWTLRYRKKLDHFLKKKMIAGIGTHSKYIQAWYMANYGIKPVLINEWSDLSVFYIDEDKRIKGRVGCMLEDKEDQETYNFLVSNFEKSNLCTSIVNIVGDEHVVAETMRTVDIFIGLNRGKHNLWGEGCPRTQQEALHSGCVLLAYDCLGNREYLYDKYTGLLIQHNNNDSLLNTIEYLLTNEDEKERIKRNGINLVKSVFSEKGKFELISNFLNLNGTTKEELTRIFPRPFWLNDQEIPFLSKYASSADKIIVEIGCAYGGSSVVFLLNKKDGVHVYSIDPFLEDSMGGFRATRNDCVNAVKEALKTKRNSKRFEDWTLINDFSHNVVTKWKEKIDLLLIDGSHHYNDVKKDFEDWSPFLSPGGLVLFHDSRKDNIKDDPSDKLFSRGYLGPTLFVNQLIASERYQLVDKCYSISVLKK